MTPHATITNWNIENQLVFLRADLNVPLYKSYIEGDYRLKALQPTLDLLLQKKAKVVLATHIGRPHGPEKHLSTRVLLNWFKEHGYSTTFTPTVEQAILEVQNLKPSQILLLENLRFYAQEQHPTEEFALQLKLLGNYYVNDAFGLLHRSDTSVTLLAQLYPKERKSIGLLVEKELKVLNYLKQKPKKPFLVILGGGKVKDKLPLLTSLLDQVNTVLLCPAIVFTFLKALGKPTGKSLVEDALIPQARAILDYANKKNVSLLFPVDYQVAHGSFTGPLTYTTTLEQEMVGLAIGPQTQELYAQAIGNASTIFLNGTMGIMSRPETMQAQKALLQTIAQSPAYSVIGGGESVAAVYQYGLESAINFCSSGGGSTLAYLSDQPLPGLKSIII